MGRKVTAEMEAIACSRYLAGENTRQIGNAFGVTMSTIGLILKRNGVKTRSRIEIHGGLDTVARLEVCRRYLAGESPRQLGNAFGMATNTINKILKRNNIKIRGLSESKNGLGAAAEPEVCRRYLAGENTTQLGKALGVSNTTIHLILRRNGVRARNSSEAQGGLSAEVEAIVCSRYLEGESTLQLGDAFGVTHSTISQILKRHNVEARSAGNEFGDSVQHILNMTGLHAQPRECSFYLFELAGYAETHCKPGISFDVSRRVSEGGGQYGLKVLEQIFATRAEAWFLEQAVLDETRSNATRPEELANWEGATEIRNMAANDMEPIVFRLIEELEELGMWEFAAAYVPMTAAQRATCQQKSLLSLHA